MSSDEGEGEEEEEISLVMVMVLRVLRMEKCSWKRETAAVVAILFLVRLFVLVDLLALRLFASLRFASFTLLNNHKHQFQLRDCLFTSDR